MISEETVFILGAGANCPYGFPTGAQLRKEICYDFKRQYLDYVNQKYTTIKERDLRRKPINHFIDTFRDSSTSPIDLFLAESCNRLKVGKYIVSFKILDAEQKSHFREQAQISHQDWYSYIFNRIRGALKNKGDINRFCENTVSFITFNYDRSLEQFFYESLHNSFEVTEQSIRIMKELKIIHVYGAIAPLDWQDEKSGIKYGADISEDVLDKTSQNLRIIGEVKDNIELTKAHEWIKEAKKIFFLGFGYARENMAMLNLPGGIPPCCKVYGTAVNLEAEQISDIKNNIIQTLTPKAEAQGYFDKGQVSIEAIDCLTLLKKSLRY